jgi:hypothetical protein
MAFGTELQGRSSHEALLAVQDAEIHLLETIRVSQKSEVSKMICLTLQKVSLW